jgi:carbonic anhydrase
MNAFRVMLVPFLLVAAGSASKAQAEGKHWSYDKHGGPAEWGEIDQAFASETTR